MLKSLIISLLFVSTAALAHPNGTYILDGKENAELTFKIFKGQKCPDIEGALRGSLRAIIFSESAENEPYNFKSHFYVETHDEGSDEYYVQTNDNCVPVEPSVKIPASRNKFGDFSLKRKSIIEN